MAQSPFLREGAQLERAPKYAPLTTRRFFTGIFTNRSPFLGPGEGASTRYYEQFIGDRTDTLIDGANVEVSNSNLLVRRPGYVPYTTALMSGTPVSYYPWRQLSGTIRVLADTTTGVYVLTPTTAILLFTKGTGAGPTTFKGVGAQLYMMDGVDAKKWDGTTVTNIGIVAPVSAPTLSFGTGTLQCKANYSYVVCYQASGDGSVSSASPVSAFTGPLTNASVTVGGDYSNDAQVGTVQIYRTADGGMFYYLLASFANVVGNGTWSFTDTLPDSSLNNFIQAPLDGVNNPPPTGATNLQYHAGRLWCSAGNNVYFSGGPDTTNGNGNTAWSALNYFTFASKVEKLIPFSQGLQVQTVDEVQGILGTSVSTFYTQLLFSPLGILSRFAMTEAFGGFFAFTSDRQFVQGNPTNGVNDLGFPIGDQLANIDPTQCYVATLIQGYDQAVYLGDPANGIIWRSNPSQPPTGSPAWSPKQIVAGGFTCMSGVEISPGQHALLIGQANGGTLMRSLTTNADNGTDYASCFATLGMIVLASPGQLAEVESITADVAAVGQLPTVSILVDEIAGTFEALPNWVPDPPQLTASESFLSQRYYLMQGSEPVVMRTMQLKFAFQQENAANVLYSYSIFGAVHLE